MSAPDQRRCSDRHPGSSRDPYRRVGDDERRAAEAVLAEAWSLGYVRQDELDERIDRVLASVTRADVDDVLADLPLERLRRSDPRRHEARRRAARLALRIHAGAVVVASLVVTVVWASVAIGAGVWFPWFVFPVLGSGAGLACHAGIMRLCASRPATRLEPALALQR